MTAPRSIREQVATDPMGVIRWVAALVLVVATTHVAAAGGDAHLLHQRALFAAAEEALVDGRRGDFEQLRSQLLDYPLYPYLELADHRERLADLERGEVDRFLARWAGLPVARTLRRLWLDRLGTERRWSELLAYYRPGNGTALDCLRARALRATGRETESRALLPRLWNVGRSQPRECDPLFQAWIAAGLITSGRAWERFEHAMALRELRLARYLRRFMAPAERNAADLWLRVDRRPHELTDRSLEQLPAPRRATIRRHGLERLAANDLDAARRAWAELSARERFDPADASRIEHRLALEEAWRGADADLERLARVTPVLLDATLAQTRLRAALHQRDWNRVLTWIDQLPEALREEPRWRYWRARALDALGRPEQANPFFEELASERLYHGLLAADRLGLPYRWNDRPLTRDPAALDALAARPAMRRAHELLRLGRTLDARREWNLATAALAPTALETAAQLAADWEWPAQVILTLARARSWDDLGLRFPLAYREPIESQAELQGLAPEWVYALARQESAFEPQARSRAGARGLMQLMPATARETARRNRLPPPDDERLTAPDYNVRVATHHLGELWSRFGGQRVLATAAYNAGSHRVDRWLPRRCLEPDLWVETIPFRETRDYVERVLVYGAIYRYRLGLEPVRLAALMRPVGATPLIAGCGGPGDGTPGPS